MDRLTLIAAVIAAAAFAGSARPASVSAAEGSVLVVGDSLGVGTEPYLRQELSGVSLTVDAQKSRSSGAGLEVLAGLIRPEHRVVVFDLGTNDDPAVPGALAADLEQVRSIASDRCMVVATLNRPPYAGVSVAGLNRAVESFAAGDPRAQVVDWHAAAEANAGLLDADGVHATPTGYAYRGQLFAEAIQTCLTFSEPASPGGTAPDAGQTVHPGPRKGVAARNRAAREREDFADVQLDPAVAAGLALANAVAAGTASILPPLGIVARTASGLAVPTVQAGAA